MKNKVKFSLAAIVLSVAVAACGGSSTSETADTKQDSTSYDSTAISPVDTTSTVQPDSSASQ